MRAVRGFRQSMKRIIIVISILALASVVCQAGDDGAGISSDRLTSVISEFRDKEGVEVITVRKFGISLLKKMIKASADNDEDTRAMLKIIDGIKKVSIVDYCKCADADKSNFTRRLNQILNPDDLIMEVRDDGEVMKMFGITNDRSGTVGDFVLHSPSDGVLICLFGTISLEGITSVMSI